MNNYIIHWHDSVKNTGGVKAKEDVNKFILDLDYKQINFPANSLGKVVYTFLVFPFFLFFHRIDNIVVQFPSGKPFIRKFLTFSIKKFSQGNLILLIHDLEALRLYRGKKDNKQAEDELDVIFQSDGLIVLNDQMKSWLGNKGYNKPMVSMQIWDYANSTPFKTSPVFDKSICFAGNLKKSVFLNKIKLKDVHLVIFGPNPSERVHGQINYGGQFSPEELPKHLHQAFGLVWDGDSIDTCSGKFGEYLKINDPHKLSLYLSSGIPVLIWQEAALADFVRLHQVGIKIKSLNEIEDVFNSLRNDEYSLMKHNAIKIGKKMREGYFLKTALLNLMNKLES